MWFLSPRKTRRPAATPSRRASHLPHLEVLEDRCLLSGGSLDPTFGGGGVVTTLIGTGGLAYAVAVQPDGKIVVAGEAAPSAGSFAYHFALARYNANGTLDTTFGSGGKVVSALGTGESDVRGVALQADGKIVVAGLIVLGGDVQF